MRLRELNGRLPTKAGLATLNWFHPEGGSQEPRREGNVISLPLYTDAEILRLQGKWNQFLFLLGDRTWFGGTDERPFLVRLVNNGASRYFSEGPSGFYRNLVPKGLSDLATKMGTRCQFGIPERQTYTRQGDIFAYKLPFSWEELDQAYYLFRGSRLVPEKVQMAIYGTRHILTGSALAVKGGDSGNTIPRAVTVLGQELAIIGEGTIKAPDHKPVNLEGLHALFQTTGLFSPTIAD